MKNCNKITHGMLLNIKICHCRLFSSKTSFQRDEKYCLLLFPTSIFTEKFSQNIYNIKQSL